MRTTRRMILSIAAGLSLIASAQPAAAQCAKSPSDAEAISGTVRAVFAALAKDDEKGFGRNVSPGFYAFEIGKRYSGPELLAVIKKTHQEGVTLEWNIQPLDVHVECDTAWAAWENIGKAGKAPDLRPMVWLESAAFKRVGGRWMMEFLHSTPRPSAKPQ